MTYARARLWLGISGVGSLVLASSFVIFLRIPQQLLSGQQDFSLVDVRQLAYVAALFVLWLVPFDFLGGYYLPRIYRKSFMSFQLWCWNYLIAAFGQSLLFMLLALLVMTGGRIFGLAGGLLVIAIGTVACFLWRHLLLSSREVKTAWTGEKLAEAVQLVRAWQTSVPTLMVVRHDDVGFTGGISGLGKKVCIVIPQAWLNAMSREELATAIARRAAAINSGSYLRGLGIAFTWNCLGFAFMFDLARFRTRFRRSLGHDFLRFYAVVVFGPVGFANRQPQCFPRD